MQSQINLTLENADELIQKADVADNRRVVVKRFLLWVIETKGHFNI